MAHTGIRPTTGEVELDAGGVPVSALLAEPADRPPRGVVLALHGGGMRAGYFAGVGDGADALTTLGPALGWTVLAVDRPGYGRSAEVFPAGLGLDGQAAVLRRALADFAARHDTGGGVGVVAHSYGGKLALVLAADGLDLTDLDLIGLDISGCGHRYAVEPEVGATERGGGWRLNWGLLGLYPPDTLRRSAALVAPFPAEEWAEAHRWPERFGEVAARVRVPVRLTFAEHEHWWRHDDSSLADLAARLGSTRVVVDRLAGAGHNAGLGWAARAYHLRALAFLEECLVGTQAR
ncbi:hypothetical protein UO65_1691 [Actinokineospora spheciospongiae]|uniref:AB hydrolase-1 domain-containing protein n=1 Tax=Actinokineospora spheciospongiae TaxID=909613 RepID=W7J1Y3_9PSEU|nr:alpha/beta hydrolase [Actinokineospora spheciospongiae]EWC62981.1 hypothetical protein UO65_1691 [Actinokineospora spheciospongiae]